jgi:photosystem II stability/assembly factor-like uncharacterized protein
MHRVRVDLALLAGGLSLALACHDVHIDFQRPAESIEILDDLYSVSVVDENRAVAAGYYGAIYYTEDGGQTWEKGRTNTNTSLYKVAMADALHGWAVGQRGLILRTEDGGKTWTRQPNLKEREGAHLFSVTAIDDKRAWVVGTWGTRMKTEDGGATWVDHSFTIDEKHSMFVWLSPPDQERVRRGEKVYDDVGLNDVYCRRPPSRMCWLIGEFGYLYWSDDDGDTWNKSTIEGSVEMEPIYVAYNKISIPEADQERLAEFAKAIADEAHLNVAIESFASPEEVREFGDPDDPFELFEILEARSAEARTVLEESGILSDRLRMRGQPPWDYEDFLEDDPLFLQRYLDKQTKERPQVRVRVIQNPYLFTIRFWNDQEGLIAGLGGVILRSSDGGKTWVYRKIDRKQALFAATAVDGRAVAVGEKGLVRFSVDEGRTWRPPEDGVMPEIYTFMRDVAFDPRGRVGYMVGQGGQILRTRDAGYEWEKVLPAEEDGATAATS